MSKIIDVSEFNGIIDWKKVKKAGVDYAIIRAGGRYGVSGHIYDDDTAYYNCKKALENGIGIGLYFFTQAVSTYEAEEEADYIIQLIKKYKIIGDYIGEELRVTLPLYIDTEYLKDGRHNELTKEERTEIVLAFCKRIEEAGYKAGVYASLSWFYNQLKVEDLLHYSIWIAQYNDICDFKYKYDLWQYTSSGRVDGINGRVDLNKFGSIPKTYSDEIKIMAVDTMLGKYGNGTERAEALGKYYEEVQSLINELLEGR